MTGAASAGLRSNGNFNGLENNTFTSNNPNDLKHLNSPAMNQPFNAPQNVNTTMPNLKGSSQVGNGSSLFGKEVNSVINHKETVIKTQREIIKKLYLKNMSIEKSLKLSREVVKNLKKKLQEHGIPLPDIELQEDSRDIEQAIMEISGLTADKKDD